MPEWVYLTIISALWSVLGIVLGFLLTRLIRAIDRLADKVGEHALDLMQIKTKLEIK